MTFVLNILHKDYSLLATDRRGQSSGPVTLTTGGLTIKTTGESQIEGVKKIRLSKGAGHAVGIAGTVTNHGYLDAFTEVADGQAALKCVGDFACHAFDFGARDRLLQNEALMVNQSIVTFFDPDKEAFFSALYSFTQFGHWTQLYARKSNPSPTLLHVGSGSGNFEAAVGLDEINSFIAEVAEGMDTAQLLAWLDGAFAKVSEKDAGCSPDYEAVIATRDAAQFTYLRRNDTLSLRSPARGN